MARKRRKDNEEARVSYDYSKNGGNGSVGLSAEAQRALDTGSYGKMNTRKAQYNTSQEQTQQAKSLPVLKGISIPESNTDAWESNLSKNKSYIDTDRARRNYEQKIDYKPMGKALSEKDADLIYNGALRMINNNMSASEAAEDLRSGTSHTAAGMAQNYIKNKDWEKEYGKSLEALIDEYANNENAMRRHTEEVGQRGGKLSKTAGSVYLNAYVKPVAGARAAVNNLIDPDSQKSKNANKIARLYSDISSSAREDVTKDMSGVGKTAYNLGTNVADRLAGRVFGNAGHALTLLRTAEDTRESLEDRGITGRGAQGQALASGLIDAGLDVVGLEKIKGLKALRDSGQIGKALVGSAAIGGGEQFITSLLNEAIDRVANKDSSVYATNVENYKAQGMSEDDAKEQALLDTASQIAQEAGQGALFGAIMGVGGNVAKKAVNKVPELIKKNPVGAVDPELQKYLADAMNQPEITQNNVNSITEAPSYIDELRNTLENSKPIDKAQALVDGGYFRDMVQAGEVFNDGKLDDAVQDYLSKMEQNGNPASVKQTVSTNRSNYDLQDKYGGDWEQMRRGIIQEYTGASDEQVDTYKKELDKLVSWGGWKQADPAVLDDYVDHAPTYQGQISRGMHFEPGDGSYENFMNKVHESGTVTLGKPSSWTTDPETSRLYSHMGDNTYDSVEIVCNQNRTSTPINYINMQGEDEILSSSKASWTVLNEETYTLPNGAKKTVLYVAETGDKTPPKDAAVIPDNQEITNEIPNVKPIESAQAEEVPNILPAASNDGDVPPKSPSDGGNIPNDMPDNPPIDGDKGKSKVITNSALNAGIVTPEQIDNDPVIKSIAEYAKHNNETTLDAAKQNVAKNGAQMLDDFNSGKTEINSDQTVDESFLLLRSLTNQIEELGENAPEDLIQKKNLLLSRLRKAGTKYGQTIQAFAKWNKTPDGALVNGERILEERTSKYKSRNKKKVEINTRIAKALEQMGNDTKPDSSIKEPKTREQIVEGIRNVLKKEFGSVEDIFTEDDINFLADLAENKKVPIWQITDEIEHRLNHGEWYDITEEIPEKKPTNQKLQNALNELIEREPAPAKEPLTREQLVEQVRNTLDKESASLEEDFTDDDIEYIANLIQNGATKVELADALNTKLATGTFGISADTEQKVNSLFKYAEKSGMNSKAGLDAMSAAYKLIADETVGKATPFEKFEAWRYLAMLGNTKTMMRNMVGNVLFNATTDVSNGLSALIESGVDKAFKKQGGIQRQKAILNPTQDAGLIKTAWADGEQNRWSDISGTKYEKSQRDAIKSQKSVFDNRLLQLYEKATDAGISDTRFVHAKYSTSLAGYLKANGLNEDAFRAEPRYRKLLQDSQTRVLTDAERTEMNSLKQTMDTLEKARDYAVKQAEYATFHEDNAVAQWLTKNIQEARNSDNAALRAIGTIAEGVLPFKKTPANILKSGFEYSPLGAIKSIAETGKLIYENTGRRKGNLEDTYTKRNKFTGKEREVNKSLASDVIESWSKTLTGSGLALLGYYLADKGILRASGDDDKYQNDLEGKQQYSIEINGKTYTVDWAAPAVMPMLLGAEANKIAQDNLVSNESVFSDIDSAMGSLNALLDPILETSFMQGVQNALESAANQVRFGGDGKGVPGGIAGAFASNALASYATQGIPTFLGQIARTVDPIRRATDTGTESNFLSEFEKTARKTANKIPFLSKMVNEPYYDAYGRTQNNSPFENPLANFAYQALSPSYVADINETQADKSARDAYNGLVPVVDENGNTTMQPLRDSKAFASWKNKVTVNGKQLKPKEIAEYRKTTGETNYAIRTALAKEDWFSELSPTKQTEILNKVNNLVDKVGKEKYTSGTGKDYEAYKEGGIPSLLDYYRNSGMKKEVQEKTGLNATSNAAKTILADLESGNKVEAEQKIDEATQLADLGFTKPGPTDTYYKAKGIVPELTPDEFARTYKAIDADGNQGIKQDEIIAYLNKGNYTEAEGMQIWSMYAPKGKKVPYIKDDGTWGKH